MMRHECAPASNFFCIVRRLRFEFQVSPFNDPNTKSFREPRHIKDLSKGEIGFFHADVQGFEGRDDGDTPREDGVPD
jgi:hypothetical protein